MRLAVCLLAVALGGSIARADEPKPATAKAVAKIPLRVVRMLPDSHQALLFDRDRGTHVLAEVGTKVDGFEVEDIADDEVTLVGAGGEVVLAAPQRGSWRRRGADANADGDAADEPAPAAVHAAKKKSAPAAAAAAAPADPYAATTGDAAPADPYATADGAPVDPYGEAPVRVVEAPRPIVAGEGGIRTVDAADPTTTTTATATPTTDSTTTPATSPMPSPSKSTTTTTTTITTTPTTTSEGDEPISLSRSDVSASLSDFGKLTGSIHAAFTPAGVRIDSVVAGSLFARGGLRAGDVVTAVDGKPLRTLDDAADLYATSSSARNLTVSVLRNGKPALLRVAIK